MQLYFSLTTFFAKGYEQALKSGRRDGTGGLRMSIPTMLALLCGLRRGEISALVWRNVDLDKGQLAVRESIEQMNGAVPRPAGIALWPFRPTWLPNCGPIGFVWRRGY